MLPVTSMPLTYPTFPTKTSLAVIGLASWCENSPAIPSTLLPYTILLLLILSALIDRLILFVNYLSFVSKSSGGVVSFNSIK